MNELRILAAIRQHGALSKAEIARATGLSAQGVSIIVRSLLKDELLVKEAKVRGQVGQPSTPLALNPAGASTIGIKIGRRSLDVATMDFRGEIKRLESKRYDIPLPADVMALASRELANALSSLGSTDRERVVGIGLAIPGSMDLWWEPLGLDRECLAPWRSIDVAAALEEVADQPVLTYNDMTAACAAEIAFGESIKSDTVLYVFVGTFIGGGIVINGRLHVGAQGNAGALGPMPMDTVDDKGRPEQLLNRASLIFLERELLYHDIDVASVMRGTEDDPRAEAVFQSWLHPAAQGIARAVVAATSVIDFQALVIDGGLRADWKDRLVCATKTAMESLNWSGLSPIETFQGRIGNRARAIGAALLPLHNTFSPEPGLLVQRYSAPI
ncbi:MAG: ROK family transcriptional regulator [Pseudomonadota bacterium]